MLLAVVVVPKLRGDEDLLTLYETPINRTLDALTSFFLVLVVVRPIEEPVARLDSLL